MEIDIFRKSSYYLLAVYNWALCWWEQNFYCLYVEKIPEVGDVSINNIREHDLLFTKELERYKYEWSLEAFIAKFWATRVRCQKITLYNKHWDYAVDKKRTKMYKGKWMWQTVSYIQVPELTDSFTVDDPTVTFFCWIWDEEKRRQFCFHMKIPYIYEYNELDWEITTL